MRIRAETTDDHPAIAAVIERAFVDAPHSNGAEARIVAALRNAGALTLSLVGDVEGDVVGHVAFSPVTIDGTDLGWFGLGPVAVVPERQRQGIGEQLITAGLDELRARRAAGCVVLGEPDYYRRFGFRANPELALPDVLQQYFQVLAFDGDMPAGTVAYHPAFAVA